MRLTNTYYVDYNNNMVSYPKYAIHKIEVPAAPFHAKLKIVRIGWLNSGFYLELQDENGKLYSMNDAMFREYIINNNMTLEGDWNFYKQGTAYSIGL